MPASIIAKSTFALAASAFLGNAPAIASSYQYATFGIKLSPPGNVTVTGLDAKGDVAGYVGSGSRKKAVAYAFSYVNGNVQLATPIGGKFFSFTAGMSSNGVAIVYKYPVGKKHLTALKWDVAANKLSALYTAKLSQYFFAEYINSHGDLAGTCASGACFVSDNTVFAMTKDPGALNGAGPFGLNDAGFSGGWYFKQNDNLMPVFTYIDGTETDDNIPNGGSASPTGGVASNNALAGSYRDASGVYDGFVLLNGVFTSYAYPGATGTSINAINASGQIVGSYSTATGNSGFLYQNGTYYNLSVSGGTDTYPSFINDAGTISGSFTPAGSKYQSGFVASCSGGPGTCTP